MGSRTRWWLIGLSVAGLLAAGSSTYVHYRILVDPGYTSFCDVGATLNCTQVYTSRFGQVWNTPVALVGFLWFAGTFLLVVVGGRASASSRDNVPGYVFALSTVALAAVLYLGYASWFILKATCILCVVVYGAVAGIFLISGAETSFPITTLPRRGAQDLRKLVASPLGILVVVLFVAGSASALTFFSRESLVRQVAQHGATADAAAGGEPAQTEFARWWDAQARVDVPVPNDGAKVVVIKFNDYQCPACGQTYMNYRGIFAKYESNHPGAVRVVMRDYPLDPECNGNAPNGVHLAACEAAVAVRLAREHGRAEVMEEWLFANQASLTPARVREGAREVAGVQDFDERYADTLDAVKRDIALGAQLLIEATPTFFVNGVRIRGGLVPEYFDAALARELERVGQP